MFFCGLLRLYKCINRRSNLYDVIRCSGGLQKRRRRFTPKTCGEAAIRRAASNAGGNPRIDPVNRQSVRTLIDAGQDWRMDTERGDERDGPLRIRFERTDTGRWRSAIGGDFDAQEEF